MDIFIKQTFMLLGPFARYYFGQANIKPFIHTGIGFGKNNEMYNSSNVHYPDDKVESKLSVFDAGGGISFVLMPKVTLEVGISYGNAISKFKTYNNEDAKNKVTGVTLIKQKPDNIFTTRLLGTSICSGGRT